MTVQRDNRAESPRLHVNFLGREFSGPTGPETFEVTSTLTNIYDGWSLNLPIGPGGLNEDIPDLNPHRWLPITIQHADPAVGSGKAVPMVMGVCTGCVHETSDGASVLQLTGYDLGKLLDSCAPPWIRIRGVTMEQLCNLVFESSWLEKFRADGWGFKGVTGLFRDQSIKLGKQISQGRADAVRNNGGTQATAQLPPIQTEVGESSYDLISKYARLTGVTTSRGSFVSCSADGYLQIFNPDDYRNNEPLYVFNDTNDGRNVRVKRVRRILDGEDLYSEYHCYSSVVQPPVPARIQANPLLYPNFGRIQGASYQTGILGTELDPIIRRLTYSDPEQYEQKFARARAEWRKRQSLYRELSLLVTIQGHSLPGPDGQYNPVVEGNIAEFHSTRQRISGKFMIEQTVKRQNDSIGTECDIVLRRIGLLGA